MHIYIFIPKLRHEEIVVFSCKFFNFDKVSIKFSVLYRKFVYFKIRQIQLAFEWWYTIFPILPHSRYFEHNLGNMLLSCVLNVDRVAIKITVLFRKLFFFEMRQI
jgi:hypothetical protein